jgi:SAM-dependent methyltransferase
LLAAKRGAEVSCCDASEPLLEVARERLPAVDIRRADLEELPYQDQTFDVATSFNAVQYAADPVNALRELKRVCVPDGRVAVVVWGPVADCEMRDIIAAIGSLLPPPPPGSPGPFALSEPGALEQLVMKAGLRPQVQGDVPTTFEYADLETAWRANAAAGPGARAIELVGEDRARQVITNALAAYQRPDGSVVLQNSFRFLVAAA